MKPGDMVLEHLYENGEPVKGAKYKATLAGGEVRTGTLDGSGKTVLAGVPKGGAAVEYEIDPRKFEHKPDWEAKLPDFDTDGLKSFEAAPNAKPTASPAGDIAKNAAGLAGQAAGLMGSATQMAKDAMAMANPSALASKAAQAAGLSDGMAGIVGAAANAKSGADLTKNVIGNGVGQLAGKAASMPLAADLLNSKGAEMVKSAASLANPSATVAGAMGNMPSVGDLAKNVTDNAASQLADKAASTPIASVLRNSKKT